MGLFGTAFNALKWGFSVNFKHIGRWLLLTLLSIIPIVFWISDGALMRVLKGEEPDLSPVGKNFVNGFFLFLIALIYAIIPCLIMLIPVVGQIIGIILLILVCIIMIPAEINFARTGKFGAAFKFSEIFGMISKLGWGKYILAIIVMLIFVIIISLILGLITMIPIVGLIVVILVSIPLLCFELKYWNDIFA